MTLNDFLKRVSDEDKNKMMIFTDGEGWDNIGVKVTENEILVYCDGAGIFSDDKG